MRCRKEFLARVRLCRRWPPKSSASNQTGAMTTGAEVQVPPFAWPVFDGTVDLIRGVRRLLAAVGCCWAAAGPPAACWCWAQGAIREKGLPCVRALRKAAKARFSPNLRSSRFHVLLFVGVRLSVGRATPKLKQAQHGHGHGHCRGPGPSPSPGSIVFHGYVGWPYQC